MKTLSGILKKLVSRNVVVRLYKYYIIDSIIIVKKEGFKSLLKKRGWRVFAVVVGYYLVRDSIVYIIVPYLIAQNII